MTAGASQSPVPPDIMGAVIAAAVDERFAFGGNWLRFLETVGEDRIAEAVSSMQNFLETDDLAGRTLLDLGSGSGLFSLAAARMGADEVRSVDYDPQSVACTEELRRRFGDPSSAWEITRGDATDTAFIQSLGQYDIVYSWGVLHHTAQMWKAMENACGAVNARGQLFISIYNDQGIRSRLWRAIKHRYVRSPQALQLPYAVAIMLPRELLSLGVNLGLGHPREYIHSWTHYKTQRGMSRWHDLIDWVGGYPFEVATPEQVFDFCRERGFRLDRLRTAGGGLGCNQFVFTRCP